MIKSSTLNINKIVPSKHLPAIKATVADNNTIVPKIQ